MAAARFYSSTAGAIDLTGSIASGDTAITVNTTTGLPGTTPFTLVLDPGTATEEIVNVTNVAGLTLTVTRGVDGSSAQTHSAGVGNIRHMATARDYREPQEHIGASTDVHGLSGGASVVGTSSVQNLTNKTALAATAATKALVVKGTAAQTASYLEVQDSTGTAAVKVQPGEGTVAVTGTTNLNDSGAANLFGYVARLTAPGAAAVAAILKAAASQTADILQLQNSAGTVLAKFDKDGKLTTPQVTSTGDVAGTTGTFSGAVTSPTVTALDGRVGAIETNLGAQTTFAGTSATKDGKKIHWGTGTGTPDGSGFITVTHGAGFTPTVVLVQNNQPGSTFAAAVGCDTLTSTQFRVRFYNWSAGGSYTAGAVNFFYTCME